MMTEASDCSDRRERPLAKKYRQNIEAEKDEERDSPLIHPAGIQYYQHFDFRLQIPRLGRQ